MQPCEEVSESPDYATIFDLFLFAFTCLKVSKLFIYRIIQRIAYLLACYV